MLFGLCKLLVSGTLQFTVTLHMAKITPKIPETVPLIDGNTVLLLFTDFKLETLGDVAQIPRLASSLSACAQLNTLSATQRTWALHRLRKLVISEVGPVIDVPALFGYNLMYDQPFIKMKHVSNQRMNAVCTLPFIHLGYWPSLFDQAVY